MTKSKTHLRAPDERNVITASEWKALVTNGQVDDDHLDALAALLSQLNARYRTVLTITPSNNSELAEDIKRYSQLTSSIEATLKLLDGATSSDVSRPPSLRRVISDDLQNRALEKDLDITRSTLRFVAQAARENLHLLTQPIEAGRSPKEAVVEVLLVFWLSVMGRPIPPGGGGTVAQFVYHAANLILRTGNQRIASAASARALIKERAPTILLRGEHTV